MSHKTGPDISYTFTNSDIDWTDKVSIDVPSWASMVYVDFFPGGALQSGADNVIAIRLNNDTTTNNYGYKAKYHNGTSYLNAVSGTESDWEVYEALTSGNTNAASRVVFCPECSQQGTNSYLYGLVKWDSSTDSFMSRNLKWFNDTDRVSSFQVYSRNSTAVSFSMNVRFV